MSYRFVAIASAMLLLLNVLAFTQEVLAPVEAQRESAAQASQPISATPELIRTAVTRSLRLIESSGAEYRRQRECFSCHHQALPILTILDAKRCGFDVDEQNLDAQLEHTASHLVRGRYAYAEGRGQGGQADTAGWALWALAAGGRSPDETTEAVVQYLIGKDREIGHWRAAGTGRRPTQGSDFTPTFLALYGLSAFASGEQSSQANDRRATAEKWLIDAEPTDTEDRVFRLRAMHELDIDETLQRSAASELVKLQRSDGGWAQTGELASDAYATGTVLTALIDAGQLKTDDAAYQRGIAYLLATHLSDGSWKVTTRAKPIQTYFESGFPHGRDQFISMAATCWATMALLKSCEQASASF
jgi:N-acyl-D-amino-acid deacylase